MEAVLDLYSQPYDPQEPVVCFDERPVQLIRETCVPLPPEPGKPERHDYEYKREGTCNLFAFFQPLLGGRHIKVSEHPTSEDFALCMHYLVDVLFPDAGLVHIVLDNLNTHTGTLPNFSTRRSTLYSLQASVSLHSQTRQLAEYG